MIANYLKLSLRLLVRNPFFACINLIGLSVGFASFFALWQYADSELKVNHYHNDAERIGRLGMNWDWTDDNGKSWEHVTFSLTKPSLPPRFEADYPEVESTLRMFGQPGFFQRDLAPHGERIMITVDKGKGQQEIFKETRVAYADENLFEFFTIPLLFGQKDNVLKEPNCAVLSQATSRKYFGPENPVGKLIRLNDTTTLQVTGVFEDFPHNTHLGYEIFLSNQSFVSRWNTAWLGFTHNYVKLKPGSSFKNFEGKLKKDTEKYFGENLKAMPNRKIELFIQPLRDVPFSKNFTGDDFPMRSRSLLLALSTLSVVVLVMAWTNYINLSATRTTKRVKEFAVRKAVGAINIDLIRQLLIESALLNVVAIALAITFLQIVRAPLAQLFNIHAVNLRTMSVENWLFFFFMTLFGILITGIYPALLCLKKRPQTMFSINSQASERRIIPSVLTTTQLTAAVALIAWGFIVFLQLDFILNIDSGLNKEQVIVVESPIIKSSDYESELGVLTNKLRSYPDINKISSCWKMPGDLNPGGEGRRIGSDITLSFDCNGVDENFIPLFEVQLLAGRNFLRDEASDAVILSQVAAERLGFKKFEGAIGADVEVRVGDMSAWKTMKIIGVINDYRRDNLFNFDESNSALANGGRGNGILLSYKTSMTGRYIPEKIALKLNSQDIDATIKRVESSFKDTFPGNAFAWYFLKEHMNRFYGNEKLARNQLILFTILAIGIACLGLLGMIMNKVIDKTKEIGVRKVLGARGVDIGVLLINTTIRQLALAVVMGLFLSWYLTEKYLEKYSERVVLHWWHYAIPPFILLIIMFFSIASALFRAIKTNPADSLRNE